MLGAVIFYGRPTRGGNYDGNLAMHSVVQATNLAEQRSATTKQDGAAKPPAGPASTTLRAAAPSRTRLRADAQGELRPASLWFEPQAATGPHQRCNERKAKLEPTLWEAATAAPSRARDAGTGDLRCWNRRQGSCDVDKRGCVRRRDTATSSGVCWKQRVQMLEPSDSDKQRCVEAGEMLQTTRVFAGTSECRCWNPATATSDDASRRARCCNQRVQMLEPSDGEHR